MKTLLSLVAASAVLVGSNAMAIDTAKLGQSLMDSSRSAADKELDDSRKPVEVLDYLGLEEGMTAIDFMAGAGWFSEVLSRAVGPNGKVYLQNSTGGFARGSTAETTAERIARLGNIERLEADVSSTGLADNSVDFAITNLNFHDIYNSNPEAGIAFLREVKRILKPGASFGLIDHEGTLGADNATLHRIALDNALMAAHQAGLQVVGVSDILDVMSDDHSKGPFDPSLGRNTDRIILRLTKSGM